MTPATGNTTDTLPPSRLSPAQVYMGLSRGIRRPVAFIAESILPTRAERDLESATPTAGPTKLQGRGTSRKSGDTPRDALAWSTSLEERTLMNIPPELHMVILEYLDFADIRNLRLTCRYWHGFATPQLVRSVWGRDTFRAVLIRHCRVCMAYRPAGLARLCTTPVDAGYPLSSRCLECTVQARDGALKVGRKTKLGNYVEYWTCRWCGWPVTHDSSATHSQFHQRCYSRYALGMLVFFLLGWAQLFIGIVASALCWRYFRGAMAVLAPTTTGFLLMWLCVIFIGLRGNTARTYHWALLIELAIAALWIAPVYSISKQFMEGSPDGPTRATMVFIGLNMLFRLLNILGNIVLLCDYDRTVHYVPRIPIWRRLINPMLTALILWTWPQHAERIPPPDPIEGGGDAHVLS